MDDMDRTPHPEQPAEGASGSGGEHPHRTPHAEEPAEGAEGVGAEHTGDPDDNPEHNTAPDGQVGDAGQDDTGGNAPLGGHDTTEEQLDADNAVERDTLKTLDPDDPPA